MLIEKLLEAMETGEILRVRYFGGSTPGAERQLKPISISDGKVRAYCLRSGEVKLFCIEKLDEVVDGVPSEMAALFPVPPTMFSSVAEFVDGYRHEFEGQGWVVQQQEQAASLHRAFKNGKVIQTPDVALTFEAETCDEYFDGEQLIETNRRARLRPWTVYGKKQTTKTFSDLGKAELTFLEYAKQLAPKTGK